MLKTVLVWVAAYLYGSTPFVDMLARIESVDLKDVGSGNVGATNLMSVAGVRIAIVAWLLDASKGLLPALAARKLGLSRRAADLAGVFGTAGQCWPASLGFSGGRGISAFIGAAYAMDPRSWLIALVPFIAGSLWRAAPVVLAPGAERPPRSRSVPFGSLVGVLAFALARWLLGGDPLPSTLLAGVILVRRLTAPLPDDVIDGPSEEPSAYIHRFLYDRNTAA